MTKQEKIREETAKSLYLRYGISAVAPDSGLLLKWEILGEGSKEQWRENANQLLSYLRSQGVVIEVKREFRKDFCEKCQGATPHCGDFCVDCLQKAGYPAVEPLLEVRKNV